MVARTLGFIGLGAMGYPMALNLLNVLDAGARLHIYDVSRDVLRQMQEAAPELVHVCSSAREVTERSVGPVERFAEMEHPRADLAIRMSFSLLSPRERMSAQFIWTRKPVFCPPLSMARFWWTARLLIPRPRLQSSMPYERNPRPWLSTTLPYLGVR